MDHATLRLLLADLRAYAELDKSGKVLAPSRKDPSVKRWQNQLTDIPRSGRTWGAGETERGLRFKDFFSHITNGQGFGQHIDTSIPGYAEHRAQMAWAVAHTFDAPQVLDVGASEGQWGASIQEGNPRAVITDLDPNPDMLRNNVNVPNAEKGKATSSTKVLGAWVEGFHDGERDIPTFTSEGHPYDVVGMHMVRQFVTRDGDEWYGEVKKHLKPGGVFLYSCKVTPSAGQEDDWKRREAEKDDFKRKTYTQEEMDAKSDEVLVGMHHLMMPHEEEMASLGRHFAHVVPIWHSANFRGYAASDDHDTVTRVAGEYTKAGE